MGLQDLERRRLARRRGEMAWRLATSRLRLLPGFLIIGAAKSGTNSLYQYTVAHPNVGYCLYKEVHFFDSYFAKGVGWYRAHFPLQHRPVYYQLVRRQPFISGEASPYYIFHPSVPERVQKLLPKVKLMAILRNPVDRAYSHYQKNVRRGMEPLSFEEAIQCEEERLRGLEEQMLADQDAFYENHQLYSYVNRGIYADQLARWLRFYPREQLLMLRAEDLQDQPAEVMDMVFDFLDLPAWRSGKEYRRYAAYDYAGMNVATREQLLAFYRPHNERLADLLKMDFRWDE